MDVFSNASLSDVTIFNLTSNRSKSQLQCYYLYERSRTFYIPLLHALVTAGLIANLYILVTLYRACSKDSAVRRRTLSDTEVVFAHLGVCDIATLLTIPVRVTQRSLARGWVFGHVVCKLMKGVITVGTTLESSIHKRVQFTNVAHLSPYSSVSSMEYFSSSISTSTGT